jgi:UDP-3-O-[3-hydroxymyristoyl] glucosamine N-acyltransferase
MPIHLGELARLVGGRLSGDASLPISGAATLRDAGPGEITLADKPQLSRRLAESAASAVVVPADFPPPSIPTITVEDVHRAFARIVECFRPVRVERRIGISPAAHVSPRARLGENVDVHPAATIGDDVDIGDGSTIHSGARIMAGCRIGRDVVVFPNAVLYENTEVGDRAIIHAGAVLGAYGFGYAAASGRHIRSAQLGNVRLGNDVEIGACATIDRGTYGPTLIGEGTKIDNQVMIAHNCRIGRHNLLCSHVGIAGSVTTGDYVVMAGQVGIRDHVMIGDGAIIEAKAGIMSDVPPRSSYVGIPAMPEKDQLYIWALTRKLPRFREQIKALREEVDELRRQANMPPRREDAA